MSIDRLTAELRSGGKAAGEGGFSLDRDKAREKLRQFQLADPHRWVLLVIQALVDRGATSIRIEIDTDDVRIDADGTPLTGEDFEELYSSLYSSVRDRPGLRELALGSNAAMALNPKYLRIDSGDGRTGVRLELRVGEEDRIETLSTPPVGTRVHAKERFRPGLVVRFLRRRDSVLPEQVLVRERCRWSDVAISLGEQRVSAGVAAMLPSAIEVASTRLRGWLAFDPAGGAGMIVILRLGVLIVEHELPSPSFVGARAVLVGDNMRTDASMSDVVRDEHYEAWMVALDAAHEIAITQMLATAIASGALPSPTWIRVVRDRLALWLSATPTAPQNPALTPWWTLPIWRTLAGEPVTTAQLVAMPGEIRVSSETITGDVPREISGVLHVVADDDKAALTKMFGKRVADRSALVKRAFTRQENGRLWRRRPHAPRLPDERSYAVRVPIAGDEFVGEAGICNDGPQRSLVRIVVQGCMLVEMPVELGLSSVHAVIEGSFHPNHMCDGVAKDGRFVLAVLAIVGAVDAMARAIAETAIAESAIDESIDRTLSNYLYALVAGKLAFDALVSLGVDKHAAEKQVTAAPMPWAFVRERDLVVGSAHPLVLVPFTTDGAGRPVSLLGVAAEFARDGVVRVIALKRPNVREPPLFVVRAGERKLELLRTLFGADAVTLVGAEYERWITRDERIARMPARELAIGACAVGPLEFVDGPHRGIVGLLERESDLAERRACVTVTVDQRPLSEERIFCGIAGVAIAIDVVPDLADVKFEALEGREAVERVGRSALVGVEALIAAVLDPVGTTGALPKDLQPFAVAVARLAWPVPPLLRAWLALRRELGDDDGTRTYAELIDLLDQHEFDAVITSVRERLEQSVIPLPQMIGPALARREHPVGVPWTALRRAAVARLNIVLSVPCLLTLGGSHVPLQRVVDAVAAGTAVRWVPIAAEHTFVPGFEDVLALDEYRREALSTFVGDDGMLDVAKELELESRRHSFEQRAELSALALEPDRAIIRFPVEHDTVSGELGIPARAPGSGEPGAVLVCHGRRPIQTIDPEDGLPWVGVLGGDFGRDTGFERVSAAERWQIAELCNRHGPRALRAITDGWRELPSDARGIARAWALQLLARVAPGTHGEPVALAERGIAALATLPIFVDSAGHERTLDELYVEWRQHGDIVHAWQPGIMGPRIVVAVQRDVDVAALGLVFGKVRDYAFELAQQAELAARLRAATPMPVVPQTALAMHEVDGRGLIGQLWLDDHVTDESAVMFGRDGRVVGEMRVSSMFPCKGAITGPGLDIADDWSGFELSGPQQNQLKNDACSLWESLVLETAKAEKLDERRARPLRNLLLRLHAIPTARRSWPNHDQRKLYRELRQVALFAIGERAINLVVALREKPAALDHLGLWNPRDREISDTPAVSGILPPPQAVSEPPAASTANLLPEARLLAAVRDELRLVRTHAPELLAEVYLERITMQAFDGATVTRWHDDAVAIDTANPVVQRAIEAADSLLVAIVASAVFTTINCALEDVTDIHELEFLRWHAAHARSAIGRASTGP